MYSNRRLCPIICSGQVVNGPMPLGRYCNLDMSGTEGRILQRKGGKSLSGLFSPREDLVRGTIVFVPGKSSIIEKICI